MKWKIVKSETSFKGYFLIDKYEVEHERFMGGSQTIVREVFERGHAVAVLPYDVEKDKVVLVEQFRIGAMCAGRNPWVTELIAGIIEDGEQVEQVAYREAMEEANCELKKLIPIYDYLVSPGGASETVALFCGLVDSENLGGVYGLEEEGEDIKVHVYERVTALKMLADGQINNAMAIIGLQWLQHNYQSLGMK